MTAKYTITKRKDDRDPPRQRNNLLQIERALNALSKKLARLSGPVFDYTVSGGAVSSINIPNLDINRDGRYELVLDYVNAGTTSGIELFVNGDTTSSNYYSQQIYALGTGQANKAAWNIPYISYASANGICSVKCDVFLCAGYFIAMSDDTRDIGSSLYSQSFKVAKTNTTISNITSLTVASTVASMLGVGTRVRLYAKG